MWLTDNTYKYEDLVRMMGEIISALEGKIRVSGCLLFPFKSKLGSCEGMGGAKCISAWRLAFQPWEVILDPEDTRPQLLLITACSGIQHEHHSGQTLH